MTRLGIGRCWQKRSGSTGRQRDGTRLGRAASAMCVVILLVGSLAVVPTAAAANTSFSDTYTGWTPGTNACSTTYKVIGQEPNDGLTHPVFIYVIGTGGDPTSSEPGLYISGMANRGYVAAAVGYSTVTGFSAHELNAKAECIYNTKLPNSAASVLCARPTADCSKGIVTAALSQGAYLAVRSANHEPLVHAAYVIGLNDAGTLDSPSLSQLSPPNRVLPSDHITIMDGGNVALLINKQNVRQQLNTIMGLSCATTANSCFYPNGAGWYLVQGSEVQSGKAGHCYEEGNQNNQCTNNPPFDPGFLPGQTHTWSLDPNLDFIKQFAAP